MEKINRRAFIGKTSIGLGSALALSQLPKQLFAFASAAEMPIGFQTWVVKDILVNDFAGTLKMMAGQGYQLVEMCSPKGYVDSGFGPLVSMKTADMRSIINAAGLSCPSCHFGFGELTDDLDNSIEFATLDGQLIYDALMNRFDPNLVKMQFQTEVINLGYKASTYFNKYPGRFISSHLSDWTSDKKEVPVGKGIIDWKEFFAAAKTGGVKNFFVEMSLPTLKDSATYIHAM